jgi:hypothetical protein
MKGKMMKRCKWRERIGLVLIGFIMMTGICGNGCTVSDSMVTAISDAATTFLEEFVDAYTDTSE